MSLPPLKIVSKPKSICLCVSSSHRCSAISCSVPLVKSLRCLLRVLLFWMCLKSSRQCFGLWMRTKGSFYLRWICWMRCMLGWDSSWMNEIQSFLTGRWCLGSSACIRWVSRVCMLWILNFHSPNDSRKSCPIFCKLFVLVLFWFA